MSRLDSSQKMAGGTSAEQQRTIQPGRLMIVLMNQVVSDDLIAEVVSHYGPVRSVHRPENNPRNVFVQYEDPECLTDEVIFRLKNVAFFRDVSRAKKADRFLAEDGAQDQHQKRQQKKRPSNEAPSANFNSNSANFNGNSANFNGNSANNNLTRFTTMDSPPQTIGYKPDIPLGCWNCTKLPSFECRCGAFYCDINCQRADWPKHKDLCMPRMVPISYSHRRILENVVAAKQNSMFSSLEQQDHHQQMTNFAHQQQQHNRITQQRQQPEQQDPHKQMTNFGHQQQQHNRNQQNQQQQQYQQNRAGPSGQKKHQAGQDGHGNRSGPQINGAGRQQNPHLNQSPDKESSPPQHQEQQNKAQQDSNDSCRVSQVGSKLQRLKLAKAGAVTNGTAKPRVLQHGPFPPEGARVKITSSLNSGIIYIYNNNGKQGRSSDYQELSNRVLQAVDSARPLQEAPSVDDVIFAPFQGIQYRAKVLKVKDDILEVQFVDFGNLDKVKWREGLQISDEEVKWARILIYPVTLEGVDQISKEMKQKLESFELVEDFELVKAVDIRDSNVKQVVLRRPKENVTLNMNLVELKQVEAREKQRREEQMERERQEKVRREREEEQTRRQKEEQEKRESGKIADPDNYRPVLFEDAMTIKQLPENSKQTLLIIDASDMIETKMISVIAAEDAGLYEGVVQDCETRGNADPNPYKPTEAEEVCLVKHQNDWSRALFDITEDTFMLLDIGIFSSAQPENIRRFPPGLGLTVYNNEMLVENAAVLENMMIDRKPESIHGKTIEAWVSKENDIPCVRVLPPATGSQTN